MDTLFILFFYVVVQARR